MTDVQEARPIRAPLQEAQREGQLRDPADDEACEVRAGAKEQDALVIPDLDLDPGGDDDENYPPAFNEVDDTIYPEDDDE
jgi:hypothetical protein